MALGVSGGFLIVQQRAQTQAKFEAMEKEKEEAEAKLADEQKKREEEEVKRQESEKMRLEAEKERAKAEELRRQAEIKAQSQPKTIVVDPSSIVENYTSSSPSIAWQPTCGDSWDSYSQWWAVKGSKSALSIVKNNYCGDALVVKGETQVASFKSESAAWSFANSLSAVSGYDFWVKKSDRR
ncbi:hypothetical protein [Geminocystis herdmanii]|uniref:hypothetical protein n=1 Tax=Geminocystis herdmanii TaxID=669359 RepID=UPI000694C298|nr:hypothetical protein [Geminocystis herdmanii]